MKRYCECGCGQEIIIKRHHKWYGIPKFINGHQFRGKPKSEEHKKKISKSLIGKPSWNKGISRTEETKKKISLANKGKIRSEEVRKRMKITRKGRKPMLGKHHSKETKLKMSQAKKGKNNNMYDIHLLGEKNGNWRGGKSFEPYTPDFNQQLKDRIRVRDNFICQLCGVPELECDRRLDIHHIDYNKQNCKEDNLITLCLSCNIRANFNRHYWKEYYIKMMEKKCPINE